MGSLTSGTVPLTAIMGPLAILMRLDGHIALRGDGRPFAVSGKNGATLSWQKRLQISLETARGLDYLHNCSDPAIIHRDVKPSNILLDKDMSVKVADFGISKLVDINDTTVSTRVAGTIGYLDPAFLATQKLTRSSDVYSFGIVLLELITGKMCPAYMKSNPEIPMSEWALDMFNRGGINAILDPKLQSSVFPKEAITMLAKVAFLCVKEKRQLRPVMRDIVQGIENCLVKARNEVEVDNSGSLSRISSQSHSSDLIDIEALERRFHAGVHVDTILLCPAPEITHRNSGNSGKLIVHKSGKRELVPTSNLT
ncbi:hypothetical protein CBR_g16115 [Chara braunii]|uniref:Protein kinase domain-containing protein n=1 Tax=Chara braunii TaxID=69332 RepID=A0A388KTN6_CHABU|nr:hypothetical protein CBR_g16115 [Chara braunii]|eukprot:GBG73399.1 hypothetical protein CBR_g16115 [Chara braunii]